VLYLDGLQWAGREVHDRLRDRLHESGAEYVVVKNRLVLRALDQFDAELPDLKEHLKGPTGS
jgi:ribosomal protein L10